MVSFSGLQNWEKLKKILSSVVDEIESSFLKIQNDTMSFDERGTKKSIETCQKLLKIGSRYLKESLLESHVSTVLTYNLDI